VNGRVVTELGTKVSAEDLVCLDGSRLGREEKLRDSPIPTDFLIAFRKGVEIEGVVYKAKVARRTGEKSARIVLVEGKNREIRRVAEHFGLRTLGLCRVRIGKLELAGLPVGFHRDLSPEEVAGLKALVPRPKD
jgi:23S rRNA pseudouridine2605 synthase